MMAQRTHPRSRKVVDRRLLRGSGGKDSRKKIKKYGEYIWIDRLLKDSFSMGSGGRGRIKEKGKRYEDDWV